MAFTGAERVQIRMYMGSTGLYSDDDSRLESAMDTVGADSDQETLVRGTLLVRLAAIDAQLTEYETMHAAGKVDELDIDVVRASAWLRSRGRMYATRLANVLGFPAPRTDAFSSSPGDWSTVTPPLV